MGEFDAIRAKAIALIKRKGRPVVVLLDNSAAPVDATKPWNVREAAPTQFPCRAVVTDWASKSNEGIAPKVVILPGDCGLTEGQVDLSTRVKVLAAVGGQPDLTYAVLGCVIYAPDGIPIGWKLRCELWRPTSQAPPTSFSAP